MVCLPDGSTRSSIFGFGDVLLDEKNGMNAFELSSGFVVDSCAVKPID